MINFGSTCILLEIYHDKEDKKGVKSTKTRTKRSRNNPFSPKKGTNSRNFFGSKKEIKRSLNTYGDKPKQICLYLTIYNQSVYMRKM